MVQGDLFTAEVVVGEPLTYQTTMGGQLTAPSLIITSISSPGTSTEPGAAPVAGGQAGWSRR